MSDISHVGIAVDNLEKAVEIFSEILGYDPTKLLDVADQKVKVALFASEEDPGSGYIELLSSTDEDSSIRKFLNKRGPGLHHLAVRVDDIERKLRDLKAKGYRLIDETPRIGVEGKRIAFIHPSSAGGILLELQEK